MLKWDKALASHSKFKMISIDPPKKARFSLDQVFKKFQVNHPYKGGKALHRFWTHWSGKFQNQKTSNFEDIPKPKA